MRKSLLEEVAAQKGRGVLFVLTGPTGAGKDTLFAELVKRNPSIIKIVTTTSRKMRDIEKEGEPYHFISREEFEKLIAEGAFFEWVEFRGELYGTQKKTLTEAVAKGVDVIWHIDAKGIKNIKEKVKESIERSIFVFLTAPSIAILEERVKKDEGEGHVHRWNEALVKWEMEQYDDCDYLVVNDEEKLDETVRKVEAIIEAKRSEIFHAAK